jgi:crotonobetaine/carnitine-CoA ligase
VTTFPETIPDLLEWRASRAPTGPWLLFEDESWTLAEVVHRVVHIAGGLANAGVERGDGVAFVLGNRPETLFGWFAANWLGATAMILNPALKSAEIEGAVRVATPRVVIASLDHPVFTSTTPAPRAHVEPDDVAVLIATSGTTGAPKAVMQTHRAYTLTAEAFPAWLGLDASDRFLVALPLFHINAQAYGAMGALGADASLALLPKFSASRLWTDAARLGATTVNMVGAMVHILLATEPRDTDRAHAIRVVYTALALPEEQHRAFEERFGVKMIVGYGLSESTFGTIWTSPAYGTMGSLRQHPRLGEINRARVVREDGTDASDDEAGELLLHNPATMRGYWNAPEETAKVLSNGWLRTGDIVRRKAGAFTFVSRKKDVIRRRGENVSSAEIEGVMLAHPSVGEAAAIGVPSKLGEDDIVAYVAPRAGMTIDIAELRAFMSTRLADFKLPTAIHVRATLPRTATERVAKHLLE